MESAETAVTAGGQLVEAARARVRVAAALARPVADERLRFARDFLLRRGVAAKEMEAFLAANLVRFSKEQRGYQDKLAVAGGEEALFLRSTLFDQRGLSVDTSLLPNYALEDTLRAMLRKSALQPESIRTIAVIGPGLVERHDLAKMAYLFLSHGLFAGKQIVSPAWVKESLAPSVEVSAQTGIHYGYLWWLYPYSKEDTRLAFGGAGFGGQRPIVIPAYDLILVFTAWNTLGEKGLAPAEAIGRVLAAVQEPK